MFWCIVLIVLLLVFFLVGVLWYALDDPHYDNAVLYKERDNVK